MIRMARVSVSNQEDSGDQKRELEQGSGSKQGKLKGKERNGSMAGCFEEEEDTQLRYRFIDAPFCLSLFAISRQVAHRPNGKRGQAQGLQPISCTSPLIAHLIH
jgi:hypothetical protein